MYSAPPPGGWEPEMPAGNWEDQGGRGAFDEMDMSALPENF